MMAIPCLAVGALLALLVDLPAHGDDTSSPAPIWLEVGALPEALASVDAAVYVTRETTYAYLTGGKRSDGMASDNITLVELRDPGPVGLGSVRPLPVPLYGHAAVVACARLYIIGGWDGVRWHADVWSAAIEPNGALGAWRTEIGYPFPVAFHDAVVFGPGCGSGTKLIVLGGARLETSAAAVEAALASGKPLAAPDSEAMDGVDASTGNSNQVYYSTIYSDGISSTWRATTPLPAALSRHAAAIWKDVVVVTGGYDGKTVQARAYTARIADGGISGWQANDLPLPVEYHAVAVLGGRLWLLGGRKNEKKTYAEVFSAPVLTDHSPLLGDWETENGLGETRYRLAGFAADRGSIGVYAAAGIHPENDFRSPITFHAVVPGIAAIQLTNVPTGTLSAGETISYTIFYTNGEVDIDDVVVTGTTPEGAVPTRVMIWNLDRLLSNTSGSLVYTASVSDSVVVNPGVKMSWSFGESSYAVTSNTAWNAADVTYAPYIGAFADGNVGP